MVKGLALERCISYVKHPDSDNLSFHFILLHLFHSHVSPIIIIISVVIKLKAILKSDVDFMNVDRDKVEKVMRFKQWMGVPLERLLLSHDREPLSYRAFHSIRYTHQVGSNNNTVALWVGFKI